MAERLISPSDVNTPNATNSLMNDDATNVNPLTSTKDTTKQYSGDSSCFSNFGGFDTGNFTLPDFSLNVPWGDVGNFFSIDMNLIDMDLSYALKGIGSGLSGLDLSIDFSKFNVDMSILNNLSLPDMTKYLRGLDMSSIDIYKYLSSINVSIPCLSGIHFSSIKSAMGGIFGSLSKEETDKTMKKYATDNNVSKLTAILANLGSLSSDGMLGTGTTRGFSIASLDSRLTSKLLDMSLRAYCNELEKHASERALSGRAQPTAMDIVKILLLLCRDESNLITPNTRNALATRIAVESLPRFTKVKVLEQIAVKNIKLTKLMRDNPGLLNVIIEDTIGNEFSKIERLSKIYDTNYIGLNKISKGRLNKLVDQKISNTLVTDTLTRYKSIGMTKLLSVAP